MKIEMSQEWCDQLRQQLRLSTAEAVAAAKRYGVKTHPRIETIKANSRDNTSA